jgi:predicted O-methyltransferase YrrM
MLRKLSTDFLQRPQAIRFSSVRWHCSRDMMIVSSRACAEPIELFIYRCSSVVKTNPHPPSSRIMNVQGAFMGLFRKKIKQEHKIMLQHDRSAGALQPESHRPTPECPQPEHWSMIDSMTAELEVLEFLATLVTTIKPRLVVETGSFLGVSTEWIAKGLERNGFGKIISCEFDPLVYSRAKARLDASPLSRFIELRNQSSLEMKVEGAIDLFFSDSDMPIREQEVKRFLPQINPNGIILMHDASSHHKVVRDAARSMEAEGLLSVVFLPTPRGLVIAQPRAGRS